MRKCFSCQIVYHSDELGECLFCDAFLTKATPEEEAKALTEKVSLKIQRGDDVLSVGGMRGFAAKYFKSKSFLFNYRLYRNDMKMGKIFNRFFISPLSFSYAVKLPWLVINVLDSTMLRLSYGGYCEKCGFKYNNGQYPKGHPPGECEFNREYCEILGDILTGDFVHKEQTLKNISTQKVSKGIPSAYHELLEGSPSESFWDVGVVVLSIGLYVALGIMLIWPLFAGIWDL